MNKCGVLVSYTGIVFKFQVWCAFSTQVVLLYILHVDTKETVRLGLLKMKLHV